MIWNNFYKLKSRNQSHRGSILTQIVLLGLRAYQQGFRSWFATGCYFYPSCSVYAQDMIRVKGLFKSFFPILWRVLRCHPWGKGKEIQLDDPLGEK